MSAHDDGEKIFKFYMDCLYMFHGIMIERNYLKIGINESEGLKDKEDAIVPVLVDNTDVLSEMGGNLVGFSGVVICRSIQMGMIIAHDFLQNPRKPLDMERYKKLSYEPEATTNKLVKKILKMSEEEFYLRLCQMIDNAWQDKMEADGDFNSFDDYLTAAGMAAFRAGVSLILEREA